MNTSSVERVILIIALILPTAVTVGYFRLAASAPPAVQQTVYTAGKLVQFALPAVWMLGVLKLGLRWRLGAPRWIGVGLAFGGAVAVLTLGLYWVLQGTTLLSGMSEKVIAKITALGLDSPPALIALGVFYSLVHSFLEEYYWRWFVFGRLREWVGQTLAVWVSAAGFTLHHVLVLATFLQEALWMAGVLSVSVLIGGLFWAWLYGRSGSLAGPWLSHLVVDAGIFTVAYLIMS